MIRYRSFLLAIALNTYPSETILVEVEKSCRVLSALSRECRQCLFSVCKRKPSLFFSGRGDCPSPYGINGQEAVFVLLFRVLQYSCSFHSSFGDSGRNISAGAVLPLTFLGTSHNLTNRLAYPATGCSRQCTSSELSGIRGLSRASVRPQPGTCGLLMSSLYGRGCYF